MIRMQTFLRDGDQQVGGHGNPYPRLDRVLAGAKEHPDAQMLLDPFGEQLDRPALTLPIDDQFWLQGKWSWSKTPVGAGQKARQVLPATCAAVFWPND